MSKEAMKLALEALTKNSDRVTEIRAKDQAITALQEALAEQPAPMQQEPVACIIGVKGSAFDTPKTKRAYTYAEQPGNVVASKIGRACFAASNSLSGDSIDRGLSFLQELQKEGLGVFDLGVEYITPQPAQPDAGFPASGQQEPVGEWGDGRSEAKRILWKPGYVAAARVGDKLYTSPQPAQRKPLDAEVIRDCWAAVQGVTGISPKIHAFARAIEAAPGIKENT